MKYGVLFLLCVFGVLSVCAEDSLLLQRDVLRPKVCKAHCFILVSKQFRQLHVYEVCGADTLLAARYPVCIGLNYGNKQKAGDKRTPESSLQKPFTIERIEDASAWTHDFQDGRGPVLAYGRWFLRLRVPGHRGIGIHGSTNNEQSVPGRGSLGCIRLHDADIIHLKEHYACQGMAVVVQGEEDALPVFGVKQ